MRQHLLRGAAAIVFLAGTPVLAADLPIYVEPVEPAPVVMAPLWTGFYVGAQAGAAFFDHDDSCSYDQFDYGEAVDLFGFDNVNEDYFDEDLSEDFDYSCSDIADFENYPVPFDYNVASEFHPFDPSGDGGDDTRWFAGAHVGYDHQMGSFVLGAVLDANWLGGDDDDVNRFDADLYRYPTGVYNTGRVGGHTIILQPGFPAEDPAAPTYEWSEGGIDWFGTLRARAGFAMGRALIYATGGLAFGGGDEGGYAEIYSPSEASLEAESTDTDDIAEYFDDCDAAAFTDFPTYNGANEGTGYICSDDDDDGMRWGYALGGGVDFLVTDNVSVGAEALYVNLDGGDGFGGIFDEDDDDDSDLDFWTLGVKASYRFGG